MLTGNKSCAQLIAGTNKQKRPNVFLFFFRVPLIVMPETNAAFEDYELEPYQGFCNETNRPDPDQLIEFAEWMNICAHDTYCR